MMFVGDPEVQSVLPVNKHRFIGLLKAPKFVADQWRDQHPNTVVGFLISNQQQQQEDSDVVLISAESIASHVAVAKLRSGAKRSASLQSNALRSMKSLNTKYSAIDRLYLMTRKIAHHQPADESDGYPPSVLKPGVCSLPYMLGHQDDSQTKVPISVTKGLTIEALLNRTLTLTPGLNKTYHTLLKQRSKDQIESGRLTKETKQSQSNVQDSDHAARLFRYYQPGSGFDGDGKKKKSSKSRSSRLDPNNVEAMAAREDDTKQKLFAAFEAKSHEGDGSVTLQEMLKTTGQSHQYLKSLIEQIAVPVRNGERKRLSYILKPEFRESKRHKL